MTEETTNIEPSLGDILSGGEPTTQEVEDKVEEEVAATTPEETQSEESDEEGAPTEEVEEKVDETSKLKKQLKDTQSYATKVNEKAANILKKYESGEEISSEEIEELKSSMKPTEVNNEAMQTIITSVNEQMPVAMSILKDATGVTEDVMNEALNAFDALAAADPTLQQELFDQPENLRATYVLKKGQELVGVFKDVQESGSFVNALLSKPKVDADALREEITAELKKEFEEKYKDIVSPMKKGKPMIGGSAPSTAKADESDDKASLASIGLK